MALSFITTRLLLQSLGVDNFGLAEVIAGVVTMLSFLSGTLSTASSRFFTFELGRKNFTGLKDLFSQTILIYALISVLILVFVETLGFWIFSNKIVIPISRYEAALFFYHTSAISFIINIFIIPFNALVIAHENMKTFAWIAVGESILKCLGAYSISLLNFDVLKLYGLLLLALGMIKLIAYLGYCLKNYPESKISFRFQQTRFKELLSFSGWNLIGAISPIINGGILNIILNNFFGLAVNAARSVANQVSHGIGGFTTNFLMAVNPQITKYYAQDNLERMHALIRNAIRIGLLLMLWISIPIFAEMDFILSIWLNKVPEYASIFARLALVIGLMETFYPPLATGIQATGKVALYQGVLGTWYCMGAPIALLFFVLGNGAEYTFVALGIVSFGGIFIRLFFLRLYTKFSIKSLCLELKNVILFILPASCCVPIIITLFMNRGWLRFGLSTILCLSVSALLIYAVGLHKSERDMIREKISKVLKRQ